MDRRAALNASLALASGMRNYYYFYNGKVDTRVGSFVNPVANSSRGPAMLILPAIPVP
jgi:hypothetical protein